MGTKIKTFFISDLHFSHISTMYFHPERREKCGITLDELQNDKQSALYKHDEYIINLWNTTIKKNDYVYILGDFCLGNKNRTEEILRKLHGKKYLIRGNHDKSCKGLENYFEWVGDIKEAKFSNNQYDYIDPKETFCIEMCHFPLLTWNRRPHGTVCLMGHTHGALDKFNIDSKELRVDVGFDAQLSKKCGGFIELKDVYKHFTDIRDAAGCKTFLEYNEWLMEKQGIRL